MCIASTVPSSAATDLPQRLSMVLIPSGFPVKTTNDWPAAKYGIMSTCFWRSAVIVWAETITSQLPPVSAGMIELKLVVLTTVVSPTRLVISVAKSRSDPTGLLFLSSVSCGGYEVSEQTVRVPAVISWAAGTVGGGVAVGAIDAAGVVAALAAVVGAAVGVALGAVVAALLEHALATRAAIAKTLAMRIRE